MKVSYSQVIASNYNPLVTKMFLVENYGGNPSLVRRGERLLTTLAGKLKQDPTALRRDVVKLWEALG